MDGKGAEVTENECINKRHTVVKGDNLTNTAHNWKVVRDVNVM